MPRFTKETSAQYRAKATEAKLRHYKERADLLALAAKLEKSSPAPWVNKLEQQFKTLHECILRELSPGQGKHGWTIRLHELVRVQERLISQRKMLIGTESFPVREHQDTAAVPLPEQPEPPGREEPASPHIVTPPALPAQPAQPSARLRQPESVAMEPDNDTAAVPMPMQSVSEQTKSVPERIKSVSAQTNTINPPSLVDPAMMQPVPLPIPDAANPPPPLDPAMMPSPITEQPDDEQPLEI